MKKGRLSALLIAVLSMFGGLAQATTTVNLYIRPPLHAGREEAESSWMVAYQLKEAHPNWKIRVIFTDASALALQTIDPNLTPNLPKQNARGVEWLNLSKHAAIPESDFLIQPASILHEQSAAAQIPREVLQKSKVAIRMEEFATQINDLERYAIYTDHVGSSTRVPVMHLSTGLHDVQIPGVYIPKKKTTSLPGKGMRKMLEAEQRIRVWETDLIAFGNSTSPTSMQYYVETIGEIAKQRKNRTKKYHLIVNQDLNNRKIFNEPLDLPSNVQVHYYKDMSNELMEQMYLNSDLPVLASDDVTLSHALNAEKPFLYEMKPTKSNIPIQLNESLFKDLKVVKGFGVHPKEALGEMWRLPAATEQTRSISKQRIQQWAFILDSNGFKNSFETAVQKKRAQISMTDNLSSQILRIQQHTPDLKLKTERLIDVQDLFQSKNVWVDTEDVLKVTPNLVMNGSTPLRGCFYRALGMGLDGRWKGIP